MTLLHKQHSVTQISLVSSTNRLREAILVLDQKHHFSVLRYLHLEHALSKAKHQPSAVILADLCFSELSEAIDQISLAGSHHFSGRLFVYLRDSGLLTLEQVEDALHCLSRSGVTAVLRQLSELKVFLSMSEVYSSRYPETELTLTEQIYQLIPWKKTKKATLH